MSLPHNHGTGGLAPISIPSMELGITMTAQEQGKMAPQSPMLIKSKPCPTLLTITVMHRYPSPSAILQRMITSSLISNTPAQSNHRLTPSIDHMTARLLTLRRQFTHLPLSKRSSLTLTRSQTSHHISLMSMILTSLLLDQSSTLTMANGTILTISTLTRVWQRLKSSQILISCLTNLHI